MPNPILNDKTFEEAQSGWAAPQAPSPGGATWAPPGGTPTTAPVSDGPVSPWRGVMTVRGSITATAVLFVLLLASATAGWFATTATTTNPDGSTNVTFPVVAMIGVIVGFVAVIALYFKPHLAKFLGPVYAIAEGFFVGAISKVFESQWNGIVLQAALATISVFAVMLALYGTRIIKVTERMRRVVIFATLGVMVLYLLSFVLTLFGGSISFISDASPLGIGFSVLVCALAAFNLMLDFDFIERGTKAGLSKDYEWVAAVGLLVTIVWLYLEILRLLAKLPELTELPVNRGAAVEAVATGLGGGVLGGAALAAFGLGWPGAAIGAANGALGGWRGTYAWRRPTGWLAFVLDSTWAVPLTTAALFTHAVAALQPGRGGYLADLSQRANRHVYRRGFRVRRGFLVTIGNTVHGAGDIATTDARRRRVVTDHEDVHVWQGRWFGPVYPLLYGGWMLLGGACGAAVWLVRGRPAPLGKVVETCGYYLNPFEWWAYSRDANWPPRSKVAELGWRRPIVRPLSETPRRATLSRPVDPARPATPG